MAYILRKHRRARGTYLQIVETFWDDRLGKSRQKTYDTPGYVSDIQAKGIADPVMFYTEQVCHMNARAEAEKEELRQKRLEPSPVKNIGYFPIRGIFQKLKAAPLIRLLAGTHKFGFDMAQLLESLVYARIVAPCSKRRTFEEILPAMYGSHPFSYSQILEGVSWMGSEYEKLTEIFAAQLKKKYGLNSETAYMDCTNYYFEIDREDDLRRKGPSKENRHDPIVGLGLLLDGNLIPVSMKVYPGNQSEQPVLREMIRGLKSRSCLEGRTIQVADKGLNSAENIAAAVAEGDGYLFSRSVKKLSSAEQAWVLHDQDWEDVYGADGSLRYRIKECVDDFPLPARPRALP